MKRCFDSNTQIVVSILQSTNCLPTDFNFLCFCWIPPCGIFNNYTRIVACGTNEGSILILGEDKHDTGLKYLAVMPGHSTPITDIIISVDNFVFLSVSKDSTVCGWSCLDCSCIFKHKLQLNYGDYYFSLCKTMINYIWLYNYGESLYLIDLKNGEIIKHKHFPGIRSFSVISPNTGLTKEDIAVCIGILRITIYKITDDFEFIEVLSKDTDLMKHECTKVCDLGIIKIRNRHWKILEPTKDFKVLYKGTFSDLPADDYINTIEFDHNLTFFAAGSFQSRFFIVNLKKAFPNTPKTIENSTYHYLHACDPKFYSNNDRNSIKNESFLFPFFGRFAVNSQHEIIYSSNYNKSSTIIYLSENSIHTLNNNENPSKNKSKHRNQNKLKVCHSTDPQSSIVIYSKDKSIFVYSWAYQHISKTFCFDKKITAISERKINNNSLSQIIVGFQDGSIGFQLYDGDSPPVFKIALTSAIHSFIIPPISGSGQYLIVLGYDGSACVFLDDDILTSFSTPSKLNHPISKVCYTPKMLITFGFIDGSFLTYSFDKPYPLLLSLSPPEQSHLIWPPRDLPQVICPITTSIVQFQKSSIFYEIFNVPELYNKVRNMTVLSSEKPQNIRNAQKKIYSQYNKSCNFIFDLMEPSKETPKTIFCYYWFK
ncbi:hypothetical protein TRFO_08120 [Tritrichomonas foetus]|uniref:Anaphase-promoting complex subunit 4 WD40 domain-containing protein n=1 Tax=Tritrichomonas foetus TaxID=1144522 RepID=A0A1J4JM24_9EUKA|nr:hypothetical protein TRFO_08120 [Tritrichomonas foetus]|eukprot:OHT00123.1 hypothetical protein TRFO_08120 [Tritrichomonas foetus]